MGNTGLFYELFHHCNLLYSVFCLSTVNDDHIFRVISGSVVEAVLRKNIRHTMFTGASMFSEESTRQLFIPQ